MRSGDMNTFRKIVAWIYAVQLFVILPWFLGAIYRHEQSLWVWREFSASLHRHGLRDAMFSAYFYAIFYSALFVIPFCILSAWARVGSYPAGTTARLDCGFVASWLGLAFLLFADPIMESIRHIPTEDWYGWLLILWVISSFFAFQSFKWLSRLKNRTDVTRSA